GQVGGAGAAGDPAAVDPDRTPAVPAGQQLRLGRVGPDEPELVQHLGDADHRDPGLGQRRAVPGPDDQLADAGADPVIVAQQHHGSLPHSPTTRYSPTTRHRPTLRRGAAADPARAHPRVGLTTRTGPGTGRTPATAPQPGPAARSRSPVPLLGPAAPPGPDGSQRSVAAAPLLLFLLLLGVVLLVGVLLVVL